jgi:addiction module HigA family antidote
MAKYTYPRKPTHPSVILKERMDDYGVGVSDVAEALKVSEYRLKTILKEKGRIDVDLALRFARYFDTTPDFWLNLQRTTDLWHAERGEKAEEYESIPCIKPPAMKKALAKMLKDAKKANPQTSKPAPKKTPINTPKTTARPATKTKTAR